MNLEPIEWLTLINNFLILLTLVAIARQVLIQAKSNEMNSVEGSYNRFLEVDRLTVTHPELQLLTVPPSVYDKIKGFSKDKLRKRAYIELVLDVHEWMYIRQKNDHYVHQDDYLDTLVCNQSVVEYWTTMRGNFRADFAQDVDLAIARLSSHTCV